VCIAGNVFPLVYLGKNDIMFEVIVIMKIKFRVRKIGKLKNIFEWLVFETNAVTVGDFIREVVVHNVAEYNDKRNKKTEKVLLFNNNTEDVGKITFGGIKNKRKVDERVMQKEALFQFKQKQYKIINETQHKEYTGLDEPLFLNENDCIVFIKLTLLSGRRF
jgi:hypothetical protein